MEREEDDYETLVKEEKKVFGDDGSGSVSSLLLSP